MQGHKTSLSKFKKTEIISSIFSDHNAMSLEIKHTHTHTQRLQKTINMWKQYTTKQPNGQLRNQRENQKIPGDK